jgi:hypothetical protein
MLRSRARTWPSSQSARVTYSTQFGSAPAVAVAVAVAAAAAAAAAALTSGIIKAARKVLVDWCSIVQVAVLLVASRLASQQPVPSWQAATHLALIEEEAVAQQGAVVVFSMCL